MTKLLIALLFGLTGTAAMAQVQVPADMRPGTGPAPMPSARPPGLYVLVVDGAINLTNSAGVQNFSAGQFGFTPSSTQPPVVVPHTPGIVFTPPPSFSGGAGPIASTGPTKPAAVDCVVR